MKTTSIIFLQYFINKKINGNYPENDLEIHKGGIKGRKGREREERERL